MVTNKIYTIELFFCEMEFIYVFTLDNFLKNNTIKYHKNGNIQFERVIVDTNSKYLCNEYHENGNLKLQIPFFQGLICGIKKEYHECGNLKSEAIYFMNKPTDTHKEYYKNGNLRSETHYADGKRWCYKEYGVNYDLNKS